MDFDLISLNVHVCRIGGVREHGSKLFIHTLNHRLPRFRIAGTGQIQAVGCNGQVFSVSTSQDVDG